MKYLLFTAMIAFGMNAQAQELIGKTKLIVNDTLTLYVGDDLEVLKPYNDLENYSFIEKRKTISGMAKDAINDKVGINVLQLSQSSISGKTLRIKKFKKEGNQKNGEHYYAFAQLGETALKIEIILALENAEVQPKK